MRFETSMPQAKVYYFLSAFINEHGYPPSYREIQKACGFASVCSVQSALKCLKKQKLVTWKKGVRGSLKPTKINKKVRLY